MCIGGMFHLTNRILVMNDRTNKEVPVVVNSLDMDKDTFIKHFNIRHKAHLGKSTRLTNLLTDGLMELHRVFHDKIHELEIGLDHEHLKGRSRVEE